MATLFRSGGITSKLIAGVQLSGIPVNPVLIPAPKIVPVTPCESNLKTYGLMKQAAINATYSGPFSCFLSTKGINVITRRFSHTDVQFPLFDEQRRDDTLNPNGSARETEDFRRAIPPAIFYGVGGMLAMIAVKHFAQGVVLYKWLPADQKALASVEINLSEVPEGQTKTFEWRGKPVFVRHRTPEQIAREKEVHVGSLRDPQTDEERVQREEWSVLIGICTHLGCVPIANAGNFGGYYCPCHGSHYDGSGRIRKGPAPLNLAVPEYIFTDDETIIVGNSS